MTIRARITVWHAALLLVGLLFITGWTYYEMFGEHPILVEDLKAQGNTPMEEILEILLYGGLPAFLLTVVGVWFLTRRAMAPLAELTRSVERVHAGNLDEQLKSPGTGDEMDRLTEVFNDMTRRLDASFQGIRDFTLHASHELKTPLTVIRHELDSALHDDSLAADERERCARLLEEIERLAQIVDGLNFLTKTDAGLLTLEKNSVRLDELVRDASDDAQVLALSLGAKVSLGECDRVEVTGDRRRLRQLLLILTDNAIKYNLPGGQVQLALRRQGGQAVLTVANTGAGVPPEIIGRVFDRFFRGDASHNDRVEGCGLGLTIAQGIVRAHGGEIRLASEPNGLTTVTVLLPATACTETELGRDLELQASMVA